MDDVLREISKLRRRLRALERRLRTVEVSAELTRIERATEALRRARAEAEAIDGLTVHPAPRTVKSNVNAAKRQAISERFMSGRENANMRAARSAGLVSLRQLADALDVSPSFMSQVFAGTKRMPEDRAAKFKRLTGRDWQ